MPKTKQLKVANNRRLLDLDEKKNECAIKINKNISQ